MSGHTPGPWTVTDQSPNDLTDCGGIYGLNGVRIAWFGSAYPYDSAAGEAPNEADARLIAAAPDLLEALKETAERLQIVMEHTEDLMAHMKACKAIDKAEGR